MRTVRILLWVLVAVAAGGLAVLLISNESEPGLGEQTTIGPASFGGPFSLTGADGQPFPSSRLNGKPHAVFFGFAHCPDVCPTTLARMVKLRNQLGAGDLPFEIVFITVDPERDGPEEVGKYAKLFDSPVIGLTGSPAQIEQVKSQFGVYSEKQPTEDGGYSVNHSASVMLFDRDGDFVSTISPEEPDTAALDKLRRITA